MLGDLRAFLADGRAHLAACEDENRPAPVPLAHRWAERVEAFLLAHFGPAHVWRFRGQKSLPTEDRAGPDVRVTLWNGLRARAAALEKFLSELDAG